MLNRIRSILSFTAPTSNLGIFLLFLLLATAMRFFSYRMSVIDWDESTYLLIARALLNGKELYVDAWDPKPPGIFLLFAVFESLFSNGILGVRLGATVSVAGTAYFLVRIAQHFRSEKNWSGLLPGLLYLTCISFQSFSFGLGRTYGLEANTELFFLFFTALAIFQYLKAQERPLLVFLSGITIGIAFEIKYFVLFDMLALGLLVLLMQWEKHKHGGIGAILKHSLNILLPLMTGCVLPFLLVLGYFYFLTDNFDAFYEVTFEIPGRYVNKLNPIRLLRFLGDFFYLTSTTSFFLVAGIILWLRKRPKLNRVYVAFLVGWLILDLTAASLPGKYFIHYIYQAFPPLCLLVAYFYSQDAFKVPNMQRRWTQAIFTVVLLFIPIAAYVKVRSYFIRPDYPRLVARHIRESSPEGRTVFSDNYQHIVHYLTDSYPLTKYYHPGLLNRKEHQQTLQINNRAEVKKILAQQPDFIVYSPYTTAPVLVQWYYEEYELDTVIGPAIHILHRKN